MKETECSETSAYKIQTPGNYPEENIQHTEQGESLKSRRKRDISFLQGVQAGPGVHPGYYTIITESQNPGVK
jgi:hypothetical protein